VSVSQTANRKPQSTKILHAPTNIAGIAGLLARAQRDLGYDATAVEYISRRLAFGTDASLHLERQHGPLRKGATVARYALGALRQYDVFHLYFGNTLFPWPFPDLPLLRALGKQVIFHFCGCDVRNRARNLATYPISGCHECVSLVCRGKRRPPLHWADAVFVSTPDLLEDVPGAVLMPGPIDLGRWQPAPPRTTPPTEADPLRILHAPTDREIKGTGYVLAAIERLRAAGYPVALQVLENIPYAEVPAFVGRADIVVDQVMIGAYGTFAVEAMAAGRPVVCRIRDDLRAHYPPDLPVVSADPSTIYDVLERLVLDPQERLRLGQAGPGYAAHTHEMHRVAEQVLPYYALSRAPQRRRDVKRVNKLKL
jgi:glycosyltransferase involved in cell wall biosynthesis